MGSGRGTYCRPQGTPRFLEGKTWGLCLGKRGPQSRQGYTMGLHLPRPAEQLQTRKLNMKMLK